MSAKDVYEHNETSWKDEVEYAETLRARRNIFSTGLVVVAGLGAFQLSPFRGEDDEFVIVSPCARWIITGLILLALTLVVIGAYRLYSSGPKSEEEEGVENALRKTEEKTPLKITRASELLRLLPDEEEAMVVADNGSDAAWMIRAKKLQVAVTILTAANRRVSNRIKSAGFFIAVGFLSLVVAAGIYSIALNFR